MEHVKDDADDEDDSSLLAEGGDEESKQRGGEGDIDATTVSEHERRDAAAAVTATAAATERGDEHGGDGEGLGAGAMEGGSGDVDGGGVCAGGGGEDERKEEDASATGGGEGALPSDRRARAAAAKEAAMRGGSPRGRRPPARTGGGVRFAGVSADGASGRAGRQTDGDPEVVEPAIFTGADEDVGVGVDVSRPGTATPVRGRAPGQYPEWGLRQVTQRAAQRAAQRARRASSTLQRPSFSALDRQSRIAMEVTDAVPIVYADEVTVSTVSGGGEQTNRRWLPWATMLLVVAGCCLVVGLAVGLTGRAGDDAAEGLSDAAPSPTSSPTHAPRPTLSEDPYLVSGGTTLKDVVDRGVLRCGVSSKLGFSSRNQTTGEEEGFEVDLCHALAAAALGKSYRVKIITLTAKERFTALADGLIDVLARTTTHTMDRDVFQSTVEVGLSFTVPFLYDGISFGGIPPYGKCADNLKTNGDCFGLQICVNDGGTVMDTLRNLFPRATIVPTDSVDAMYEGLNNGLCNTIAGEQFKVAEAVVRSTGYTGPWETGSNLYSKEPLAMATREGDTEWSDLVFWVLQALLAAEEQDITQRKAHLFAETDVFGEEFKGMFRNAIATVGNYGEMYSRHLEGIVPRQGMNLLNREGDTGLIYSHPFGQVTNDGPGPREGGIMESIAQRGFLQCGITSRKSFGDYDTTTREWTGLDADFCRVVSAGVLHGTTDSVVFVELPASEERFAALADGDVDILSGSSINLERDVREPISGAGFSFSQPYFYAEFGDTHALATRQEDRQWSNFVYWIVSSTFYAEENGITQETSNANDMPVVNLFGPNYNRMFRDTILAGGNYGELYAQNVEPHIPRTGRNLLNANPVGPQHNPLPLD